MDMKTFYGKCGDFVGHRIDITGVFPKKVVVAVFSYTKGEARYNGTGWTFTLV